MGSVGFQADAVELELVEWISVAFPSRDFELFLALFPHEDDSTTKTPYILSCMIKHTLKTHLLKAFHVAIMIRV